MQASRRTSLLFTYTTLFRSWPVHKGRTNSARRRNATVLGVDTESRDCNAYSRRQSRISENGFHESEIRLCRSEEHTSELQSRQYLVCRLLPEKKKKDDRFR